MNRYHMAENEHGHIVVDTVTGHMVLIRRDGVVRDLSAHVVARREPLPEDAHPKTDTQWHWIRNELIMRRAHLETLLREGDELTVHVLNRFPSPLASAYMNYCSEDDPRQKCWAMVDVATSFLKLLAIVLVSQYLHTDAIREPSFEDVLCAKLRKPTLNDWSILVQDAFNVLEQNSLDLFMPEMRQAYDAVDKSGLKFAIREIFYDESGRRSERFLSKSALRAHIELRNRLAHSHSLSRRVATKCVSEFDPALRHLLKAASFLAEYELRARLPSRAHAASPPIYVRLVGCSDELVSANIDEVTMQQNSPRALLWSRHRKEALALFNFISLDVPAQDASWSARHELFVLERSERKRETFVSSRGEELVITRNPRYDAREYGSVPETWRDRMIEKGLSVTDSNPLSVARLRALSREATRESLQTLLDCGKFLPEVTRPRRDLQGPMVAFAGGEYSGLVLVGEGGSGKSTLLANEAYTWSRLSAETTDSGDGHVGLPVAREDVLLLYRASTFQREHRLIARMLRDLRFTSKNPRAKSQDDIALVGEFLDEASRSFMQSGARMWILIDALNEYPDSINEVLDEFHGLVQHGGRHGWLKIVGTMRKSAYDRLVRPSGWIESKYLPSRDDLGHDWFPSLFIGDVPIDLIEEMYEKYRALEWSGGVAYQTGEKPFCPLTAFRRLKPNGATVRFMSNPLQMRLVLAAYNRRALTEDILREDVFNTYLHDCVFDRRIDSDREVLLWEIVDRCYLAKRDAIERSEVERVERDLTSTWSSLRSSPLQQLVDLGVLQQEWKFETCHVRFAYDPFFEFLLAENLRRKGLLAGERSVDTILALASDAPLFPSLHGALVQVLLFAAGSDAGAASLASAIDRTEAYEGAVAHERETLVTAAALALDRLARFNPARFREVLSSMAKQPSCADVELLCRTADLLRAHHPSRRETDEAAYEVLRVAYREAAELRVSTLVFRVCRVLGQLFRATNTIEYEDFDRLPSAVDEHGESAELCARRRVSSDQAAARWLRRAHAELLNCPEEWVRDHRDEVELELACALIRAGRNVSDFQEIDGLLDGAQQGFIKHEQFSLAAECLRRRGELAGRRHDLGAQLNNLEMAKTVMRRAGADGNRRELLNILNALAANARRRLIEKRSSVPSTVGRTSDPGVAEIREELARREADSLAVARALRDPNEEFACCLYSMGFGFLYGDESSWHASFEHLDKCLTIARELRDEAKLLEAMDVAMTVLEKTPGLRPRLEAIASQCVTLAELFVIESGQAEARARLACVLYRGAGETGELCTQLERALGVAEDALKEAVIRRDEAVLQRRWWWVLTIASDLSSLSPVGFDDRRVRAQAEDCARELMKSVEARAYAALARLHAAAARVHVACMTGGLPSVGNISELNLQWEALSDSQRKCAAEDSPVAAWIEALRRMSMNALNGDAMIVAMKTRELLSNALGRPNFRHPRKEEALRLLAETELQMR